jgi:hypothetical protein
VRFGIRASRVRQCLDFSGAVSSGNLRRTRKRGACERQLEICVGIRGLTSPARLFGNFSDSREDPFHRSVSPESHLVQHRILLTHLETGIGNMRSFFNTRVLAASLVMAGCLAVGSPSASASSNCYVPQCHYKTVTVYENVRKPCVHYVTKYDHCGTPYRAKVVTWKIVRVAVTRQVKVCR